MKVHGVGVHDGEVGLWMEFVRGQTLAELLGKNGRFGAQEAILIGVELCSALAAVHAVGVLHRDIKAQNAMRREGGGNVLMDFGAGHDLFQGTDKQDSLGIGTLLYMAPEVLRGEPASRRSDLYSGVELTT